MAEQENMLLISYDYPHSLMLHIRALFQEKGISRPDAMLDGDFLAEFAAKYPECPGEVKELEAAAQEQVIRQFVENKRLPVWKKRVFIKTTLAKLTGQLKEYEAVELLESLMHLFHWELEFQALRRWQAREEDKAVFHSFKKPQGTGMQDFEWQAKGLAEQEVLEEEAAQGLDRIQEEEAEYLAASQAEELENYDSLPDSKEAHGSALQERPVGGLAPGAGTQGSSLDGKKARKEADALAALEAGLPAYLKIEELSEEEYKRELKNAEVLHEEHMSLSMRKEAKRAKNGNAASQCALGDFYAEEKTGHTDYKEAIKWYAFSARQGSSRAKLEMGKIFDSERLPEKGTKQYGIQYFQELAEEGHPTAQCIMGLKHYFGDGVEKNAATGIKWLMKAACQGYVEAQRQLGDIYFNGNKQEAAKWYRMAAAGGDWLAEKKLKALKGS